MSTSIPASPSPAPPAAPLAPAARHVFVDNANLFGGAQRAAATLEPAVPWCAVRVYYRNLFQLVEAGGPVITRVLAGPVPPGNEEVWKYARAGGYCTDLLGRVATADGRRVEQGVDEILHLKIGIAILKHPAPQTLVVVSGDGAVSTYGTSFPELVREALRRGWSLEVWSWQAQLTAKYYRLRAEYPGQVRVHTLDPFYRSVTFVKGGAYRIGEASVHIVGRVVATLPKVVG